MTFEGLARVKVLLEDVAGQRQIVTLEPSNNWTVEPLNRKVPILLRRVQLIGVEQAEADEPTGLQGDDHTQLIGMVIGHLMTMPAAANRELGPIDIEPLKVNDGADFTNRIRVSRPSASYILTIEPEAA